MKQTRLQQNLIHSFWFLPTIFGIVSILLAVTAVNIDFLLSDEQLKAIAPSVLIPDGELTAKILSALTTATLTMTTITFSTIMVVLTTFSSQFSPRTLQNFIADRKTQSILAIFIGGFLYQLVSFLLLKSPDGQSLLFTPVMAVLIAILGAGAFIYFINHIAKLVQVNHLVHRLTTEARKTIDHLDQEVEQYEKNSEGKVDFAFEENQTQRTIIAKQPGYIDLINFGELTKQINRDQIQAKMKVFLGDYVVEGTHLLSYYQKDEHQSIVAEKYRNCIKISWERSGSQDVEFAIQKLTDIVVRAISPSTNDPNTAINCINRIGEVLIYLGNKPSQQPKDKKQQRKKDFQIKQHDFSHYLYKAFFQICHSSKEDVSVAVSVLSVCNLIAKNIPTNLHPVLWDFATYVDAVFNKEVLQPQDQQFYYKELNQIAEITGNEQKSSLSRN